MKEPDINHEQRFLIGALKELESRHPGATDTIGNISNPEQRLDVAINALEIEAKQTPSQKINHLVSRAHIFRNGVTPNDLFPQQIFGRDNSRLLRGALQAAEKQLPGLIHAFAFLPEQVRAHILVENLYQLANSTQESRNKSQFETLATTIAATVQEKKIVLASQEGTLTYTIFNQEILSEILAATLTTGETLGEAFKQQVAIATNERLTRLTTIANQPLSEILDQMKNSMQVNKQTKESKLVSVEDIAETAEQRSHLKWDIDSLDFNLNYIEQLMLAGVTYDNFAQIITEISQQAKKTIIGGNEHHLQTLNSLKIQLQEAVRKRHHQTVRKDGIIVETGAIAELANIKEEATALYRKRLSEQDVDDGIISHQANVIMASQLLQAKDQIGETISLAKILDRVSSQSETNYLTILEIFARLGIDQTKIDLTELVTTTYSTGSPSNTNHLKGQLWEMLRPIIEQDYNVDLTNTFNQAINQVCDDPPLEILTEVESHRQTKQLINQLFIWSKMALEHLQISPNQQLEFIQAHIEQFRKLTAALFEIDKSSLDKPLNSEQLLKEIAEALFKNTPLQITYMKSHRWCYPNGKIAVTPHAGDFETSSHDGTIIKRAESTEKEKVKRVYDWIVKPLLFHGILVSKVTLLQSGEEQLKLFNFQEDNEQIENARSYVRDLKSRVPKWGIFPPDIAVGVLSFTELITNHRSLFEKVRGKIAVDLEAMKRDNEFNMLGYTNRELERMINLEFDRRIEFIGGWSREDSRRYVEGMLQLFIPLSVVLAASIAEHTPHILIVTGHAHENRVFSHAHKVVEVKATPMIPIMSINDGEVSSTLRSKTDIVNPLI